MIGSAKEALGPLRTPSRRKRLLTEDNIHSAASSPTLRKARINTMPVEEERLQRQLSLRRTGKPLNLSPVKYYETKLTLSCEAWAAYSISEAAYKRGWRPNKCVEFSGLARLVLAKTYFEVAREHPEVSAVMVRLNCYLLGEERKSVRELQKGGDRGDYYFTDNTVIHLEDLVKGMLVSNVSELQAYAAPFLGYVVRRLREEPSHFLSHHAQVVLESFAEGALMGSHLVDYCNGQLRQRYTDTYLTPTDFYSTPNELAQLMAEVVRAHPRLLAVLEAKEVLAPIRYPVGFRFYEDRSKRIASERVHPANHVVLSCRGRSNFGVVSYNRGTGHVLALFDCKFSMAEADIGRVEEWLESVARPVGGRSRILPLLRLIE